MKDIVLFATSTLPRNIISNSYRYEGQETFPIHQVDDCRSQLEPTVRLIAGMPHDEMELISLNTRATMENLADVPQSDGRNKQVTALAYLYERLAEHGLISDWDGRTAFEGKEDVERYSFHHQEKPLHSVHIRLDENDMLPAIRNAVQIVRETRNPEDRLWIVTNGGFRDLYVLLSAIISQLKVYGIVPYRVLGVEYRPGADMQKIIDAKSFDIFELVNGIHEFGRFGASETLKAYFTKMMGEEIQNDPIIVGMEKISLGTRLCNVDEYIEGIEVLKKGFQQDENSALSRSPGFQIFRDSIKSDYGRILHGKTIRYCDLIRRCTDKLEIQQALTMAESKSAHDLFDSGAVYFNPDSKVTESNGRESKTALEYTADTILSSKTPYIKDPVTYVFNKIAVLRSTTINLTFESGFDHLD